MKWKHTHQHLEVSDYGKLELIFFDKRATKRQLVAAVPIIQSHKSGQGFAVATSGVVLFFKEPIEDDE
jgi:hypothetical protein